jgi:hypothetical protein
VLLSLCILSAQELWLLVRDNWYVTIVCTQQGPSQVAENLSVCLGMM